MVNDQANGNDWMEQIEREETNLAVLQLILMRKTGKIKNNDREAPTKLYYKCQKPHKLEACQRFLKLTLQERKDLVKSKGLCFGFLSWGHISENCPRKDICKT